MYNPPTFCGERSETCLCLIHAKIGYLATKYRNRFLFEGI
jgi:hypothetical protein